MNAPPAAPEAPRYHSYVMCGNPQCQDPDHIHQAPLLPDSLKPGTKFNPIDIHDSDSESNNNYTESADIYDDDRDTPLADAHDKLVIHVFNLRARLQVAEDKIARLELQMKALVRNHA